MRDKTKYNSVFLPEKLKDNAEICCLLERIPLQDFMDEVIDQYLSRRDMTATVDSIININNQKMLESKGGQNGQKKT